MKPKVSVITTFYNSVSLGNFVHRAMECLLAQTYRNLELICVNDGSKDETLTQLKMYAEKDSRILIIDKPNEGTAQYAKAAGQDAATGDLVMLFDHDDLLSADAIEKGVQAFTEKPALEMVGMIVKTVFPDGNIKNIYSLHQPLDTESAFVPHQISGEDALRLTVGRYDFHFRGIYRREVFQKVSFRFTEKLLNADEIVERLILKNVKLIGSCSGIYTHFVHPNSSAKSFNIKKTDLVVTDMYMRSFAKNNGIYNERKEVFERVAYKNLIDAMKAFQHFRKELPAEESYRQNERLRTAFSEIDRPVLFKNFNGFIRFYHKVLLSDYNLFSRFYQIKK